MNVRMHYNKLYGKEKNLQTSECRSGGDRVFFFFEARNCHVLLYYWISYRAFFSNLSPHLCWGYTWFLFSMYLVYSLLNTSFEGIKNFYDINPLYGQAGKWDREKRIIMAKELIKIFFGPFLQHKIHFYSFLTICFCWTSGWSYPDNEETVANLVGSDTLSHFFFFYIYTKSCGRRKNRQKKQG